MEARTDIQLGNKGAPRNYSPAFIASCPRSAVEDAINKCGYSVGAVPDGEWPKIVKLMEAPVDKGGLGIVLAGSKTAKHSLIKFHMRLT